MNKGTIIALGVLAVLLLVCGVGAYSFYTSATSRLDEAHEEAEKAGAETLVLLTGGWDYEAIELRAAAELTDGRTIEQVQEEMDEWRQRLGTLVSRRPDAGRRLHGRRAVRQRPRYRRPYPDPKSRQRVDARKI